MSYSGNITKDHITIVSSDGESGTVNSDHPGFEKALDAVREGRFEDFMLIANPISVVHRYANNRITISDGIVTFDGEELHTTLADRMVGMLQDGFGIEPLANFLVNLSENVSKRAIDELYGFLQASDLTITEDGYFVAYKKIRDDYKDVYTGTMDNSLGAIVEMPRSGVDDDKDRTCSAGLHFCGRAYLDSYPGERTVVVKIHPKDVVSIPSDYHNHKGRCCKYEVIGELENGHNENGERTEASLEGSVFTGEGVTPAPRTAPETDTVYSFYPSRTDARDAARDSTVVKFKDFGADAPKGERWATVYK